VPLVGQELIDYERARKLEEEAAAARKKAEEEKEIKEKLNYDLHHYEGVET
jgi:hypothetical protein